MRSLLTSLPAALALLVLGCGTSNSPVDAPLPQALTGASAGPEFVAGHYALTIDPAAGAAKVQPLPARDGQGYQALSFDLDIAAFSKPDTFQVRGVARDADGDLEVTFTHAHPFAAPDLSASPTSQNRADLSYTGRLLVLADVPSAEVSANTFFTAVPEGEVVANTELVVAPDGYTPVGDLLATAGLNTNTFPYVLLADDGEDNRLGITNGGDMHGNYDDAPGGWQRANLGSGDGWTGYDFVHAGQTVRNTFTLSADSLASGPVTLQVAVLIKYTQPSGAPPRTNRQLHFPQDPVDVLDFAYRLPFAALDLSKVTGPERIDIVRTAGSTAPLALSVRDYDVMGTEAADSDLSDETDITLIQPGAAGAPGAYSDAQLLGIAGVPATAYGATTGWTAGPEVAEYSGLITSTDGTLPLGEQAAMLRIVDPEDDDPNAASYRFGVDPFTLAGDPARALPRVTYHAFTLNVIGSTPPVISQVSPTGVVGSSGATVTFSATATNSPTSWSWDFGGGATPNTSTDAMPMVSIGAPGTYNGTVTATNINGSSAPFSFSFSVTPPVAPTFTGHYIAQTGNVGFHTSITTYNGNLAVAYRDATVGNLNMALATTALPTSMADWTTHVVDNGTGIQVGLYNNVLVHDGKLAVIFQEGNTALDLRISMANTTTPTGPASYTSYSIDATGNVGGEAAAAEIGGFLVATYRDITSGGIKYARATALSPTSPAQWVLHEVRNRNDADFAPAVPSSLFNGSRVVNLNGNPAFTFAPSTRGPWVALAQTPTPATKTDWVVYNLDPIAVTTNQMSAEVVGGRMFVLYQDTTGSDTLKAAMATTANPGSAAAWTLYPLYGAAGLDYGDYPSLMVSGGRLVATFVEAVADDVLAARALTIYPDDAADWQFTTALADPTLQWSRFHKGVTEVSGRLAFPAYEDLNDDLMVAISSAPW